MILETKNKTINLVFKTRKIVDIANLLKNKNFEKAFIEAYTECDYNALTKIIFKLAEDEEGKSLFTSSEEVYDFLDECRKEEITVFDIYTRIAEALNEEGFFKKKMNKKELKEMISNPLSNLDMDDLMKTSVDKAMTNIVEKEINLQMIQKD